MDEGIDALPVELWQMIVVAACDRADPYIGVTNYCAARTVCGLWYSLCGATKTHHAIVTPGAPEYRVASWHRIALAIAHALRWCGTITSVFVGRVLWRNGMCVHFTLRGTVMSLMRTPNETPCDLSCDELTAIGDARRTHADEMGISARGEIVHVVGRGAVEAAVGATVDCGLTSERAVGERSAVRGQRWLFFPTHARIRHDRGKIRRATSRAVSKKLQTRRVPPTSATYSLTTDRSPTSPRAHAGKFESHPPMSNSR